MLVCGVRVKEIVSPTTFQSFVSVALRVAETFPVSPGDNSVQY